MSDYRPAKGDYVRVVLESEVADLSAAGFYVGPLGFHNLITPHAAHVVSVEQIKPTLQVGWHRVTRAAYSEVESMYWNGKDWHYDEASGAASLIDWTSVGYLGTGVKA